MLDREMDANVKERGRKGKDSYRCIWREVGVIRDPKRADRVLKDVMYRLKPQKCKLNAVQRVLLDIRETPGGQRERLPRLQGGCVSIPQRTR